MFRVLHLSDLHFGRIKHSSIDASTGLQTSLVNDMEVFGEAISLAEKEKVDAILLAGDIFDKIHVSNAVRKEVAKAFRRILDTMHLYVIVGTHDRAHDKYAAHTLSDWKGFAGGDSDHMARLHIFDRPQLVLHDNNAQIIALPEPTKGILEGKTYLQYIEEAIDKMIIDKSLPTIIIGHFTVSGAKNGDEAQDISSFNPSESIPTQFFDNLEYVDYVALGHIHMTQELGKTGKVVYPGSLNYCSFSEVGMQKGGYIIEISDSKKLEKRFVPLKSPIPLLDMKFDVRDDENPMRSLRENLKKIDCNNSIVKIVVTVDESGQNNIDEKELESLFANAKNVSLSLNVIRTAKTRDSEIVQEKSPEEIFDRYMNLQNFDDATKQAMKEEFLICRGEITRLETSDVN